MTDEGLIYEQSSQEEATYAIRLQLELKQNSSATSTQLAKDLETIVEYRKTDEITSTEFFIQLKRIECALECADGISREAFVAFVHEELGLSKASKELIAQVSRMLGIMTPNSVLPSCQRSVAVA